MMDAYHVYSPSNCPRSFRIPSIFAIFAARPDSFVIAFDTRQCYAVALLLTNLALTSAGSTQIIPSILSPSTLARFRSLVPALCLATGNVHAGVVTLSNSSMNFRISGLTSAMRASIPRFISFAYTRRQYCGQPIVVLTSNVLRY